MLRSKLAPGTRAAQEHGGAAPVIVDQWLSCEMMISRLLTGESYHPGQMCVSVQRVLVPRAELAEFAAETGPGRRRWSWAIRPKKNPVRGALIRLAEADHIEAWQVPRSKAAPG